MKTKFFASILLVVLCFTTQAQDVNIPDANFLNALISSGVDTNKDGKIQVTEASGVTELSVYNQNISSLIGIEAFRNMAYLDCSNNRISTLDLSKNIALIRLSCSSNQLSNLDLSENTDLTFLNCSVNQIRTLDLSKNTALTNLVCIYNQLSTLDLSKNTTLKSLTCFSNQLSTLDVGKNTSLNSLSCSNNKLISLNIKDCGKLDTLYCSSNQLSTLDVGKNIALSELLCSGNQLSTIDVTNNTALTTFSCSSNQLSTLDVTNNTALTTFSCSGNQLSTLDVSKNTALTTLVCSSNKLSTLDVSKNKALFDFRCSSNQLSTLDISKNTTLYTLYCGSNQLSKLDVSNNTALTNFYCFSNQLSTLDVSNNTSLEYLSIYNNPLKCLSLLPKSIFNLIKEATLCLPNLPNATFYLRDEKLNILPKKLCTEAYNASNQCTSYSNTFGHIYIDVNKDKQYTLGTDYPIPNVGIIATYETNTDIFGKYGFRLDDLNQTYTIQPVLPAGWLSTPSADTVQFKRMGEVREGKDFIVTPPVLNDVWVEASPVTFARPGFVVKYQVKVKNLGGTVQNTIVQLNYPAYLTFKSSTPAGNNLNTTHTWSAANLLPFEERIFTIEFTLSAETPLGTELVSTATISIPDDGNLVNNVSEIKQTVRGSYDPNDKLLNKGNTVLRTAIQAQEDFVYTIRFQNTGTDTAFRVIIRDTLALNKFDLKSMQTIASSHPYTLKYEGNFLNWTFNDILLPDSTTDKVGSNGFVKFKIKPLSTLAVNEEIINKAAIYFDFNKAVITNTVNTRVSNTTNISESTLPSTQTFPNPSSGLFTIRGVNDALVQVLTTTGIIIHTQNISENGILDLRTAAKGIYCLKIQTATKTEISKVVIE